MRRIAFLESSNSHHLSLTATLLMTFVLGTATVSYAAPPTPSQSSPPTTSAPSMSLSGYYLHQGDPDSNGHVNFVEYYNVTSAVGSHTTLSGTHTEVIELEKGAVVVIAKDVSGSIDFNSQTFALSETNVRVVSSTVHIAGIEGLGAGDPDSWSGKQANDGFTLSGKNRTTGEPIELHFRRATVDDVNSALSSFGLPKIGT